MTWIFDARAGCGGVLGRIAVTYVEWAGDDVQTTVLGWRVIGGPGAFLVAVMDFQEFGRAIRRKLLFEIAGTGPKMGTPGDSGEQILHQASLT